MTVQRNAASAGTGAALLLLVLVVTLVTAPKQRPGASLSGQARTIAANITTAAKSGGAGSPSDTNLRKYTSKAVNDLGAGQLALIEASDGSLLRFGALTSSTGQVASAPITYRGSRLGSVDVIGPASATDGLSGIRTIIAILCGLGMLGLGVLVGARRPVPAPVKPTRIEPPRADLDATRRALEPGRVQLTDQQSSDEERRALISACIAIVDGTSDERVAARIVQALERAGVERIEPRLGDPFDPARHKIEAISPVADPGSRGTIAAVIRRGYCDHGRLVREADVLVFSE
jgi:hypothetical protein